MASGYWTFTASYPSLGISLTERGFFSEVELVALPRGEKDYGRID